MAEMYSWSKLGNPFGQLANKKAILITLLAILFFGYYFLVRRRK